MHTDFKITDGILIVCFNGDVDHHNAKTMRGEIDEMYSKSGVNDMILDFSKVSFVDSSGIAVVLGRYNAVKEKGGYMTLCGCSEYMRTILFMSGIFTIIKEHAAAAESIEYIKAARGEKKND